MEDFGPVVAGVEQPVLREHARQVQEGDVHRGDGHHPTLAAVEDLFESDNASQVRAQVVAVVVVGLPGQAVRSDDDREIGVRVVVALVVVTGARRDPDVRARHFVPGVVTIAAVPLEHLDRLHLRSDRLLDAVISSLDGVAASVVVVRLAPELQ